MPSIIKVVEDISLLAKGLRDGIDLSKLSTSFDSVQSYLTEILKKPHEAQIHPAIVTVLNYFLYLSSIPGNSLLERTAEIRALLEEKFRSMKESEILAPLFEQVAELETALQSGDTLEVLRAKIAQLKSYIISSHVTAGTFTPLYLHALLDRVVQFKENNSGIIKDELEALAHFIRDMIGQVAMPRFAMTLLTVIRDYRGELNKQTLEEQFTSIVTALKSIRWEYPIDGKVAEMREYILELAASEVQKAKDRVEPVTLRAKNVVAGSVVAATGFFAGAKEAAKEEWEYPGTFLNRFLRVLLALIVFSLDSFANALRTSERSLALTIEACEARRDALRP